MDYDVIIEDEMSEYERLREKNIKEFEKMVFCCLLMYFRCMI